ncbi:MAG TPA: SurA N-terminal domain-containing protein [Verrucomicrobiota bacterium]|nr:SurA N-terminal domain-containing protein [Verrucomicrobiota bacterium]
MFATIRKHQTWLWGFIIAAVIVSFVIYFTPTSGRGRGGGGGRSQFGTLDGRPISRQQYIDAYGDVRLSYFLRFGSWPDDADARRAGFNEGQETQNRLVLIDRLDALNIQVSESAVAQWIIDNFGGDQPATAKAKYDNFVAELRQRHGVSEQALQGFIRRDIGINHLAEVAGLPGKLITPRQATELFQEENEKIVAEAVVFPASNHIASVQLDPAAIGQFYSNRLSVYRTPDRVQLHYLRFDVTNYLAQAEAALARRTNLAAEIERIYLSSNPNAFVDTNGQVMAPEAAKERIRSQTQRQQALAEAHKAAALFATAFETMTNLTADTLVAQAAEKGLVTAVTQPFAETESPQGLRVRENFVSMAFKLTSEDPVSLSPIRGEDAVYLIALKQRIPSQVPALEDIRTRVEQEFIQDQAVRLAREACTNFVNQLTNGLAQGKTWAAIHAEAGLTPIALPKFGVASGPVPDWDRRVDLNQARRVVRTLEAGKPTDALSTRDGGLVLYVKERVPVTDAELKEELPGYLAKLRQTAEYQAFNDWFRKQVEQSRIDTGLVKEGTE